MSLNAFLKLSVLLLLTLFLSTVIVVSVPDNSIWHASALLTERIIEETHEVTTSRGAADVAGSNVVRQADPVNAALTANGILTHTNRERTDRGLPVLIPNAQLSAAAGEKVTDMLMRQYFAHNAPDGTNAGDLARREGYEYFTVAENLALGGYSGDADVVRAWMESAGHRHNILNEQFVDIGIATGRGMFEGKDTWFAVQIFGLPQSICSEIDDELNEEIEENKKQLDIWKDELDELEAAIDEENNADERRELVEEYNELANEHNDLLEETEAMVDTYNAQVDAYNGCA